MLYILLDGRVRFSAEFGLPAIAGLITPDR